MNELLMKRIQRRLANLKDEQGYQVLDYVEFLETKYGTGEHKGSVINRIAEGVEDTMRAGRLPAAAIRGTMSAMDSATKALDKLAGAGRAAVDELGKTISTDRPASETEATDGDEASAGEAADVSEAESAPDVSPSASAAEVPSNHESAEKVDDAGQ